MYIIGFDPYKKKAPMKLVLFIFLFLSVSQSMLAVMHIEQISHGKPVSLLSWGYVFLAFVANATIFLIEYRKEK